MPLFDGGYVHFDEMRVLNKELRAMRDAGKRKKKVLTGNEQMLRQQNVVGAFGTGLLMGMYAMCTLRDSGCKTAELLAINDNGKETFSFFSLSLSSSFSRWKKLILEPYQTKPRQIQSINTGSS